jgi:thiol-disulfide isomerase/thioredoxin
MLFNAALLSGQTAFSGTISQIPPPVNGNVILEYWKDDGWKQLSNIPINSNGAFTTNVQFIHRGQYRIRLSSNPNKWGDFIINPSTLPKTGISFNVAFNDLASRPIRVIDDKENVAYVELMAEYSAMLARTEGMKEKPEEKLREEKAFSEKCGQIKELHKGTFAADVVASIFYKLSAPAWEIKPFVLDSVISYNMDHGMDKVPFLNPEILNHYALVRTLNEYYYPFNERNKAPQYIDEVMMKGSGDDVVNAFLFKFILDKMIDYKCEEGLAYLITWYATDCTENSLVSDATKNLLKALENCKPGNTIQSLTLPNLKGEMVSMESIYKKNKVTIIMFWRGNCSHCKEFEPLLEDIYSRYHSKGLEVYAIGTDNEEKPWRDQATLNNSPWPSVYLARESRKDFNKKYPVPSTPTLIAVDQNGVILRRLIMRSKLEDVLKELMPQ